MIKQMPKVYDLQGQRFGALAVIRRVEQQTNCGYIQWLCKCDCGKEVIATGRDLRMGHTLSCGCLNDEQIAAMREELSSKQSSTVTSKEVVDFVKKLISIGPIKLKKEADD